MLGWLRNLLNGTSADAEKKTVTASRPPQQRPAHPVLHRARPQANPSPSARRRDNDSGTNDPLNPANPLNPIWLGASDNSRSDDRHSHRDETPSAPTKTDHGHTYGGGGDSGYGSHDSGSSGGGDSGGGGCDISRDPALDYIRPRAFRM